MKKSVALALLFSCLLIVVVVGIILVEEENGNQEKVLAEKRVNSENKKASRVLDCKFYDQRLFETGIIAQKSPAPAKLLKGAIVPHHLLASDLIADVFFQLRNQKLSTIFIIGPNHYEAGEFSLLSSYASWNTPYGKIESDEEIIKAMENEKLIRINDVVLENDHSISSLLPYVKFYLPDAKIVPLIVKRSFSQEEVEELSSFISGYINKEAVIIGSVDFSHYLSMEKAQKKDEETLKLLTEKNYARLFSLGSDNLDSPASVVTVIKSTEKVGADNMNILFHTNSEEIIGSNISSTTSYFEIVFY